MKPLKTGEIIPGIFAVSNGQVNFYLVRAGQRHIAIDAGASERSALAGLSALKINPGDVTAVFLTHTDGDHVGGIGVFHQAQAYISKQEEQMIDGSAKRAVFMGRNKLACPYATLNDGESVDPGGVSVKCMVTPGHTKGSACYIIDGRYLFSGDSFSLKGGKAAPFVTLLNMDGAEQKKSIVKIAGLHGIDAAFTGHHGYTEDFAGAFADWRGQDSK